MLRPDILTLRQFYHSPLGQSVDALLGGALTALWPAQPGECTLAVGYHGGWLTHWRSNLRLYAMPAEQGALAWPSGADNLTALVEETRLPVMDAQFNRVALMHVVEHCRQPQQLIREAWRVLLPAGRVLVVAPNRLSRWSRAPDTPFSSGRPYSLTQLRHLLEEEGFVITRTRTALHLAPWEARWWLKLSARLEPFFAVLLPSLGGVLIVEAEKQIYAGVMQATPSKTAKEKGRLRTAQPIPASSLTHRP